MELKPGETDDAMEIGMAVKVQPSLVVSPRHP
jgi:hypothetical protein